MATKQIPADYATMTLYTTTYLNVLTFTEAEVAEITGEISDILAITFGGYTGESATNTLTIKPASGQGIRDNANKLTNALRYNSANGAALTNSVGSSTAAYYFTDPYFIIDGLQIKNTNAACTYMLRIENTTSNGVVKNNVLVGTLVNSGRVFQQNSSTCASNNNLVINLSTTSAGGILVRNSQSNCVSVALNGATGIGMLGLYATSSVIKNCAVYGYGANDYSATVSASSASNATDQASFGGTNWGANGGQTSLVGATEWESVTAGSEDFRLKSTSAKLKANGASPTLSTDIVNTAWNAAKDIGVWTFNAAAANNNNQSFFLMAGA